METTTEKLAPRPPHSSLKRVIYNVLHDADKALTREEIWDRLPEQFHKPHAKKRFGRAVSMLSYEGYLAFHGDPRAKGNLYRINTLAAFEEKQKTVSWNKRSYKEKRAGKRKPTRMKVRTSKKAVDPLKGDILGRIDTRIDGLQAQIRELQALRSMFVEAQL